MTVVSIISTTSTSIIYKCKINIKKKILKKRTKIKTQQMYTTIIILHSVKTYWVYIHFTKFVIHNQGWI